MDYDVIIVGGGPAGLTAALYTARAGLKTLIIESFSVPGQAVITDSIENYPGFPEGINGFELTDRFKKQAEKFGAEFCPGDVKSVSEYKDATFPAWEVSLKDKTFIAPSLIIATGAKPKELNIPGEDKFKGKGLSYCATCDGPFFKDKKVIVVGGGDSAIEEALFLTKFAKNIILVHRRDRLRATKVLQKRIFSNKKIEFIWDSSPVQVIGDNKVRALNVENIKTKNKIEVPCDGIFVFVGYMPNTDFVKKLLKLDDHGAIITDENMKTPKHGIFACGDCRRKLLRQVVTACGEGAVSAYSAQQYVEELKGVAYK